MQLDITTPEFKQAVASAMKSPVTSGGMFSNATGWSKEQWQDVINKNPEAWTPVFTNPTNLAVAYEAALDPYQTNVSPETSFGNNGELAETTGQGPNPAYTSYQSDLPSIAEQTDTRYQQAEQFWNDWYDNTAGKEQYMDPQSQFMKLQIGVQRGDFTQEEARTAANKLNKLMGNDFHMWEDGNRYEFKFNPLDTGAKGLYDNILQSGQYRLDNPDKSIHDKISDVIDSPVGAMLTAYLGGQATGLLTGVGQAAQGGSALDALMFANDQVQNINDQRKDGPSVTYQMFADMFPEGDPLYQPETDQSKHKEIISDGPKDGQAFDEWLMDVWHTIGPMSGGGGGGGGGSTGSVTGPGSPAPGGGNTGDLNQTPADDWVWAPDPNHPVNPDAGYGSGLGGEMPPPAGEEDIDWKPILAGILNQDPLGDSTADDPFERTGEDKHPSEWDEQDWEDHRERVQERWDGLQEIWDDFQGEGDGSGSGGDGGGSGDGSGGDGTGGSGDGGGNGDGSGDGTGDGTGDGDGEGDGDGDGDFDWADLGLGLLAGGMMGNAIETPQFEYSYIAPSRAANLRGFQDYVAALMRGQK